MGLENGLGPMSQVLAYINSMSLYVAADRIHHDPNPTLAIVAARSAQASFLGPDATTVQDLIDEMIEIAADLHMGPEGLEIPITEHDDTMQVMLGPETTKSLRDYTFNRVGAAIKTVKKNEEQAESQIRSAGDRLPMYWDGVWESDATYFRGSTVTHGGGLWICQTGSSNERPGTSSAWRLISKSHGKGEKPEGAAP